MRILLVEDNERLHEALKLELEEEGYAVDSAYDGDEGEAFALAAPYDLLILDVMLPKRDGFQLCRDLRDRRIRTPILMLTARDEVDDRVNGLDSGADDYLVKPFAMRELQARMRALLRRDQDDRSAGLVVADLELDPATHTASRAGKALDLTAREFSILEYLMRNAGRVVSREMVEEHVWDFDFVSGSNVVDVYIRRIRRKVDDPFKSRLVHTVRGVGYKLIDPHEHA